MTTDIKDPPTELEQLMQDAEAEDAIAAAPVKIHHGKDHSPEEATSVQYQKCGGGRRVIRKQIGGG